MHATRHRPAWWESLLLLIGLSIALLSSACTARSVSRPEQKTQKASTSAEQRRRWWAKVKEKNYAYIDSVYWWSSKQSTRVVIRLPRPVKYEVHQLSGPPRLFMDLQRTILHPPKCTWTIGDGLVARVRAAQHSEEVARVVLDLAELRGYNVFTLTGPDRIVIDLFRGEKKKPPFPPVSPSDPSLARQLGAKVKAIVIDPGHGGKDPGAVNHKGLKEKDIVLKMGLDLKKRLTKAGYTVYMTRDKDVYVPLEARTALANQRGADLFLSIHLNFSRSSNSYGIETYYLGFASTQEAKQLAGLENAMAAGTMGDLEAAFYKIMKHTKIKESRQLAEMIQQRLTKKTGRKDRGVKTAPFVVLIGATMPSVLAEVSFISHREEGKLLTKASYQKKIAEALAEALQQYADGLAMVR